MKYRVSSYAENVFKLYFFEKSLQGDIVAIYNESGAKLCTLVMTDKGFSVEFSFDNNGEAFKVSDEFAFGVFYDNCSNYNETDGTYTKVHPYDRNINVRP